MMDPSLVNVLLIEDDEDDFVLVREMLSSIEGTRFAVEWARSYDAGLAALDGPHDIALLDYRLGGRDGLDLLGEAVRRGGPYPVILLTGQGDREVDLEAMRSGAADFLAKDRLDAGLLERSIRYAIERRRSEDALRKLRDELEDRVRDRTAELTRVNSALTDEVAERTRAETALREADRRKDEFLATLAHELRNPLAPVSNALHAWPFVKDDPAEMEELRATMARQVAQMTRLIDDLLDVSRITRGKIGLRLARTDLRTVLDAAAEAFRPLVEARRHRLTLDVPDPAPALNADFARLVQVFGNLIHNAAKFCDDGGQLDIVVRGERDAEGAGQAVVTVTDDGPGMSAEVIGRIFDLFAQADLTLDRANGGLGIGLTLVKTLVELHGGGIEARSEGAGRGSTFVVTLPLAAPAAAVATVRPAAAAAASLPRRRVLVVDDMRPGARTLSLLLQGLGQETRVVNDGASAVVAATEFDPDVVLLDIAMPGMDGYEACRRIRRTADRPDRRRTLVALTGYGQEEDRRRSAAAGFDRHLVKPVGLDVLKELLSGLAG